jgi:hypothetical protein
MRARDRVRFVGSPLRLPCCWMAHCFSIHCLLHFAGAVLMIGGTLALGPLLILGAVLLPAATQGMCWPLHLGPKDYPLLVDTIQICFTDRSPSPPNPKHRLRERSYSRSPVDSRSRSGSPYEEGYRRSSRRERSLSVTGWSSVLWSRATAMSELMVLALSFWTIRCVVHSRVSFPVVSTS